MPPHTLHYTMPPNTTNSKSTATTANSGTTQMNTNNKSSSTTPTKTTTSSSRQRRATSASSYVFAPSWLTNLNNKSGSSTTVLSSSYVSTTDEKEEAKLVGTSKKEGLGGIRKEFLGKDGSPSLNRSSTNGVSSLSSTRSRSRDLSSSRLSTFGETESHESPLKIHSRSRSVSQVNHQSISSSSSSSFDKNFPTLAKKKQLDLDLPAKNVENIWANLDAKSKLLSPTSMTPNAEENVKFNIPEVDDEPELERRMSLVPKVENSKFDGKRVKQQQHTMKRKTSRSLSVDSVARSPNGFGFGVGIISNSRPIGQTQNGKSYLKDNVTSKPISGTQPQRQRAASISTSNGIKKTSTSRIGSFGQSTITGRKSSIGNLWSSTTMGKMGHFKIFPEEEEEEDEEDEGQLKEPCDHIEEEDEEDEEKISDETQNINSKKDIHHTDNHVPSSIEREEKFLLQLGWQKPYNKEADWAITEEEKRFFANLVRALNGISVSEKNEINVELSNSEIDRAKKRWAALVKNIKIFNIGCCQSNIVTKRVTFNDSDKGKNSY